LEILLTGDLIAAQDFFAGSVAEVPDKWTPTLSVPEISTWQDPERGGGDGHGQTTHELARMLSFTDLRRREVGAQMTYPNSKVDMYNSATVKFASGAIGTISGATTLLCGDPFQIDIGILGDRGALLLGVEAGWERLQLRRHDRHREVPWPKVKGPTVVKAPRNRFIDLIRRHGMNNSRGSGSSIGGDYRDLVCFWRQRVDRLISQL